MIIQPGSLYVRDYDTIFLFCKWKEFYDVNENTLISIDHYPQTNNTIISGYGDFNCRYGWKEVIT